MWVWDWERGDADSFLGIHKLDFGTVLLTKLPLVQFEWCHEIYIIKNHVFAVGRTGSTPYISPRQPTAMMNTSLTSIMVFLLCLTTWGGCKECSQFQLKLKRKWSSLILHDLRVYSLIHSVLKFIKNYFKNRICLDSTVSGDYVWIETRTECWDFAALAFRRYRSQ